MNKLMKKAVKMLITAGMVFGTMISAMAATETTGSITAPSNGHTYEAWQIFTADYSDGTLSNVKWGANGTGTAGEAVPTTVLDALEEVSADATDVATLAVVEQYVDFEGTAKYTIAAGATQNVEAGYYLIKDTDAAVTGNDSKTAFIVKVVGAVTISPKASVPTVEKKVKETNDSTGAVTGWQDAADYDIGDEIPYQLTGTLPATYADYTAYYYEFHDAMTNLTYEAGTARVYALNGTTYTNISAAFNVKWTAETKKLDIWCVDLKKIEGVTINKDTKIVVRYTATLDAAANLGSTGNPNEVTLEFSNNPKDASKGTPTQPTNPGNTDNPDDDTDNETDTPNENPGTPEKPETGTTPKDVNIVFTYKGIVNKVDENQTALTGAGFTLYKWDASVEGEDKWVAVGTEVKGENLTTFEWTGIDAGQYKLKETTTPAGYNTCDDILFTVVAVYDTVADLPKLTSLVVKDAEGTVIGSAEAATGETFTVAADTTAETTTYAGTVSTTVVNESGATLPTTGGMGTTLFYAVGSILVLAAGVLLVVRKRMAQ